MTEETCMENLLIERGEKNPFVEFKTNGQFVIDGKSIPENSHAFFHPILEWLFEYANHPAPETMLTIRFDYFNTSSSKYLLEILKFLESSVPNVKVVWVYDEDDQDMMEAGENYKSIIHLNFTFLKYG